MLLIRDKSYGLFCACSERFVARYVTNHVNKHCAPFERIRTLTPHSSLWIERHLMAKPKPYV